MNYIDTLRQQVIAMSEDVIRSLPSMAIAIVVLFLTYLTARSAVTIADKLTAHARIRDDLKQLVATLVRLATWVFGIMVAATVAVPGMTPASIFAGLGVGALAIGFAFQDIFENFLAGVLIMIREKMHIGDLVTVQGIQGRVERITLRETHLRQLSGDLTIMPNSMLFKNPVNILTDTTIRRDEIVVGISYDADLSTARNAIRDALHSVKSVENARGVDVLAREFGASSIDFLVRWWTDTALHDRMVARNDVVFSIKAALDAKGIEIPFPQVTNSFSGKLPIDDIRVAASDGDDGARKAA